MSSLNHYIHLFELYQEEDGGTFTHEGKNYDLNTVFELVDGFPVAYFKLDDLSWVLAYDTPDPIRVQKANIQFPLLVAYSSDNRFTVIDGLHRMAKALEEGNEMISGIFVEKFVLEQAEI